MPTSGALPAAKGCTSCASQAGHGASPRAARRCAASGAPPAAASQSAAGSTPCSPSHCSACPADGVGSGRRRQRDTSVGSRRSGASATSRNTVCAGGSSSTFSKALADITFSACAGYSSATRQPPRCVAVLNHGSSARIWSMRMSLDGARLAAAPPEPASASSAPSVWSAPSSSATASGRMRRRSGWLPLATQAQAAHSPHARPWRGDSHSRLAAAAAAKSSLPMPPLPWISQACAKRSRPLSQERAISVCQGRKRPRLMPLAPPARAPRCRAARARPRAAGSNR